MRSWIDLFESHDHPHTRGEDEWFSAMFGMVMINVDQAKRMVNSGEITARAVQYPVRQIMDSIYEMDEGLFGSQKLEPDTFSVSMMGPPIEHKRLASIPADRMNEPVYFVMLDSVETMWLLGMEKEKPESSNPRPQIIDGNHRLYRRYVEGDEGSTECLFILWPDAKKITFDKRNQITLAEIEADRNNSSL